MDQKPKRIDQEAFLAKLEAYVSRKFRDWMVDVDDNGEGFEKGLSPIQVLSKSLELAKVGQKRTISISLSFFRGADVEKPEVSGKVSANLKAATPPPMATPLELWDVVQKAPAE